MTKDKHGVTGKPEATKEPQAYTVGFAEEVLGAFTDYRSQAQYHDISLQVADKFDVGDTEFETNME